MCRTCPLLHRTDICGVVQRLPRRVSVPQAQVRFLPPLLMKFTAMKILTLIIKQKYYAAFKEKLTWVKHKPSNIGNAKIRHLKYSEDIVVFSYGKYTFNPQYTVRHSDRVRQAQKGNSKQWYTCRKDTQEVSFGTQYPPRDWNIFDADRKLQGNVLNYPAVVSNSKEKVNHPTQKPIALLEYLIHAYTNEGDTVLDCAMGSGSTMVACVKNGRKGLGI